MPLQNVRFASYKQSVTKKQISTGLAKAISLNANAMCQFSRESTEELSIYCLFTYHDAKEVETKAEAS